MLRRQEDAQGAERGKGVIQMKTLRMIGLGGQGVVTAGKWLAIALGTYEALHIKTLPSFGHERRGSLVTCDLYVDSQPILIHSFIAEPDLLCCFSPKSYEIYEAAHGKVFCKSLLLMTNTDSGDMFSKLKEQGLDLFVLNQKLISERLKGRHVDNVFALAALSKLGWVSLNALESVLSTRLMYAEDISVILEEVYEVLQKT